MEVQANLPNGSSKVNCIKSDPIEEVKIKDAYNVKAATVLGVIHIICGIIAFGADIGQQVDKWAAHGLGIGTSVIFFVSGSLSIGRARSQNKYLMMATRVMTIISTVAAAILLLISLLLLVGISLSCYEQTHGNSCHMAKDPYWWMVAAGAIVLITAIASTKESTILYHTDPALTNLLVNPNLTLAHDQTNVPQ